MRVRVKHRSEVGEAHVASEQEIVLQPEHVGDARLGGSLPQRPCRRAEALLLVVHPAGERPVHLGYAATVSEQIAVRRRGCGVLEERAERAREQVVAASMSENGQPVGEVGHRTLRSRLPSSL